MREDRLIERIRLGEKEPAGSATEDPKSVPVDGTTCIFQTCYDVNIHPIVLSEAFFEETAGHPPAIKLRLELQGPHMSDWQPGSLMFFLSGDHSSAADLYFLLQKHLKQIVLTPLDTGQFLLLTPDHLRPVGFSAENDLFPYPSNSFPGYRTLQEYFILPSKFLFLDLVGVFSDWTGIPLGTVLFLTSNLAMDVITELCSGDEVPSLEMVTAEDS